MNSHGAPKYFPFTEKEKKNYLKNGFGNKKKTIRKYHIVKKHYP